MVPTGQSDVMVRMKVSAASWSAVQQTALIADDEHARRMVAQQLRRRRTLQQVVVVEKPGYSVYLDGERPRERFAHLEPLKP